MREVLLGAAETGAFVPLWSDRILEEWVRAAAKLGPEAEAQARGEAALLQAKWPGAAVEWPPSLEDRLWSPDPADVHVLAAAVAGSADVILTLNAKDFPRHVLAEEGVSRADPDTYLRVVFDAQPDLVADACAEVLAEARRLSGAPWEMRALLKKARLPRLAKAVA